MLASVTHLMVEWIRGRYCGTAREPRLADPLDQRTYLPLVLELHVSLSAFIVAV